MKQPLAVAIVLALAVPMLLLGCGKDNPVKPEPDKPFVYPDQSTPTNTILRMAAALEQRDSVTTGSVYAADYLGTSIDLTDFSPATLSFTKSDEIGFVGALRQSSSVTFVRVEFYLPASWYQIDYASDPPEWITIQIPNFRIQVSDGFDGFEVGSPSAGSIFEFTLRPTLDASSPTDTTWTIVRWVESRAQN